MMNRARLFWVTALWIQLGLLSAACPGGQADPGDVVDASPDARPWSGYDAGPPPPQDVPPTPGLERVDATVPPDVQVATSTVGRVENPSVTPGEMEQLTAGMTDFAVELFRAEETTHENLIFSPLSISYAMAMVYGGARTQTAAEIANVLHFTLPPERLHPAFNALDLELETRGPGPDGDPADFALTVINSTWANQSTYFEQPFLDLLAMHYGSPIYLVDFAGDPEHSRWLINNWVAWETTGLIGELIAPGLVHTLTRLVLVNALYFKAGWANGFEHTGPAWFVLRSGELAPVNMMHAETSENLYRYQIDGNGVTIVDMPFRGGQLSMVVIMPDANQYDATIATLDGAQIRTWLSGLTHHVACVELPQFTLEAQLSLRDTLMNMGMPSAFEAADFSGITGDHSLFLEWLEHQAVIAVDEEGVEAAAATAAGFSAESGPSCITVDRPFLFFIRDVPTGAPLFFGRMESP